MATVCRPGFKSNPRWRGKPGQRQCLKKKSKKTLKQLQNIASLPRCLFIKTKGYRGFTRTLSVKA